MSNTKEPASSSPTRLYNLSPEKYGKTAFRELSYTPEKLNENFLYKEVTVTKKIEVEKKRIRELESLTAVQQEKIKQLELEIETVRKSLQLQIEMYKQMLKDQEDEKAKHIKQLQTSYNIEIQKLLNQHEEDSKVAQAEKEQLEARIAELLRQLEDLDYKLNHGSSVNDDLSKKLELTQQNLKNALEKQAKTEELGRIAQDRASNEITSLNKQLEKERNNFKQQLESTLNEKARELDNVRKLHDTELDKQESKRMAEMSAKNLELKELTKTFENEGRRLDEIIAHKDRVNNSLTNDLNKERETLAATTKHYESEINDLLHQKQMLLADMERVNDERNRLAATCQGLEMELGKTHNKSEIMINGLRGELSHKNAELLRQNERLLRTVDTYEKELSLLKDENFHIAHATQADVTRNRATAGQLAEQNRHLALEVKNLREVLMQSSLEMERCKEEFLRLDREKQRLARVNIEVEGECHRLRALLGDREVLRHASYNLKSRY